MLSRAGLTPAEAGNAHELMPEAVAARGDGPPVLCHGDLIPDHVFVAAGADAAVGPAPFWDDHGRRLALGQLRLLTGFTAYDLRTGKMAEAGRDLADLKTLLASPAVR